MIRWNKGQMSRLSRNARVALEQTAEAVKTDIIRSQTMPYAEDSEENRLAGVVPGEMQGSMHVRRRGDKVELVTATPYARRLYYHPEYQFYKGHNVHAGGLWYEPYKPKGARHAWAKRAYAKFLRRLNG